MSNNKRKRPRPSETTAAQPVNESGKRRPWKWVLLAIVTGFPVFAALSGQTDASPMRMFMLTGATCFACIFELIVPLNVPRYEKTNTIIYNEIFAPTIFIFIFGALLTTGRFPGLVTTLKSSLGMTVLGLAMVYSWVGLIRALFSFNRERVSR